MQPPLAKFFPVNLPIGDTPDKRSVPHKRIVPGIPPLHCHKNIPKRDYLLYIAVALQFANCGATVSQLRRNNHKTVAQRHFNHCNKNFVLWL